MAPSAAIRAAERHVAKPTVPVAAKPKRKEPYGSGIKFNLTDSGKSWVRFIAWTQVWLRMIHNNPGTKVGAEEKDVDVDVMLRRVRLLFFGQLTDRVMMLTHFGINNQTFKNNAFTDKAPTFFIHDAWVQFEVMKKHLYIGGGLHYYNGVSRLTNGSTLNMLAVDEPILNWSTINSSDQFGRWLGIFFKGKVAGLDYRLAVNRPFIRGATDPPVSGDPATLNANADTWAVQGYFNYQFLDQESNYLPFAVGTYLGKKSVFNVGFGFLYQPDAFHTLETAAGATAEKHDQLLIGADVFFDKPLGDMGALTAYAGFWYYDMGPNRLVTAGIANYAGNPAGNAYPLFGSGKHFYTQMGYLLPESVGIKLQPYFTFQMSKYDALEDPALVIEGGLNWFLIGHHAKITLHYRARPIFNAARKADGFRSEIILQGMVFI
ncbi:MAG: porin [Deltaproteobacteria bacterium]|nr:porin [Deltaproteobacteria bacterium]